jgi:carboxyl-terminal processing protease
MAAVALRSMVRGEEGATLRAVFLDGGNRDVALDLALSSPPGEMVTFGNLPPLHLEIRRSMAAPGIGCFAFDLWFDPPRLMDELQKALSDCRDCDGFIINLRGNIGGLGALAMGFGGWFVDRPDQKLGTLITRDSRLNFVLNPRPQPFTRPLAILVDEMSASTSEIFAGGLQDLGRARVFGTRTPGAALPSTVEILPNGDRLQYAFANYISAKGEALEARGVIPDEVVRPTRGALLAGTDPALDAAVRWIRSQREQNTDRGASAKDSSTSGLAARQAP